MVPSESSLFFDFLSAHVKHWRYNFAQALWSFATPHAQQILNSCSVSLRLQSGYEHSQKTIADSFLRPNLDTTEEVSFWDSFCVIDCFLWVNSTEGNSVCPFVKTTSGKWSTTKLTTAEHGCSAAPLAAITTDWWSSWKMSVSMLKRNQFLLIRLVKQYCIWLPQWLLPFLRRY